MNSDSRDGVPLEAQLRQACAELDRRLRAGEDCLSEQFFTRYPALAAETHSALDLIWTEYDTRRQVGRPVTCESICGRYPKWRVDIERLLTIADDDRVAVPAKSFEDDGELEDYEPIDRIGHGPMGEVRRVRQISCDRDVVVKMFAGGDRDDMERFRRGAEDQARLNHANIVPVYEVGELFFAMELAEGGSLDQQIAARPQPPEQAARCVETLARAMQYAHEQGIVHRDLKPANVVLTADGVPKITDFGLAKHLDAKSAHTQSGALVGTLAYMAPEQVAGKHKLVGPHTDVYALGCILYEMLTGQVPFSAKSPLEFLQRVQHQLPEPMRKLSPGVSPGLESICRQCLEKQPQRRYSSAQELAQDLGRWLHDKRPRAHGFPARASRFLRAHPILHATVALIMLATLSAVVAVQAANYYLDPDRVVKDYLEELERGHRVHLMGATGGPRWQKWVIGDASIVDAPGRDGTFSFSTLAHAYLELMPVLPAQGFRFRVQVRHEFAGVGGEEAETGVYFVRSSLETAKGTEHCFCAFRFNDGTPNARDDGKLVSEVSLGVRRRRTPGRFQAPGSAWPALSIEVLPGDMQNPKGRRWRTLIVEMTDANVSATWDGQPLGTTAISTLVDDFQKAANRPAVIHEPTLNPSFAPVGGLGIYVTDGWASFRNAVVEVLDR